MRLILIDNKSGFIFGDTADFAAGLEEWRENNSRNNGDVERVSVLAARLLDESIGAHGRDYEFCPYVPTDTRTGYLIYLADVDGANVVPVVTYGENQQTIAAVTGCCRLEGFVTCLPGCV